MKKSLIALAALATVGAAQAQTATVYGRIDQGYRFAESTTAAGIKTETANINGGGWTSSRLGVNLSEDLGGGLRAIATWESNLTVIDSSTSPSATAATSLGTIRQAFAGVRGNFGQLTIGNQYLPEYFQGITNLAGTVNGGLGYAATDLGSSTAAGMRRGEISQSNNIQYVLPKFGATTVSVVYGSSANEVTAANGSRTTDTTAKLMGISANYAAGKLNGTLSYSHLKRENLAVTGDYTVITDDAGNLADTVTRAATCTAATNVTCITNTAPVAASNTTQKNLTASGIYDFGAVKAFGFYADRQLSGTSVVDYTTYNVGVQVPMGKIVPFAMIGEGKQKNASGAQTAKPEFYQVGATYNFSKRTLAYGYFNKYKDKVATTTTVKEAENMTVGLVHQF
jgi:predicted porin